MGKKNQKKKLKVATIESAAEDIMTQLNDLLEESHSPSPKGDSPAQSRSLSRTTSGALPHAAVGEHAMSQRMGEKNDRYTRVSSRRSRTAFDVVQENDSSRDNCAASSRVDTALSIQPPQTHFDDEQADGEEEHHHEGAWGSQPVAAPM